MIREITSKSNDYIKELLKIKKSSKGAFLIEGSRFVGEAIKRGVRLKSLLFVDECDFCDGKCDCYRISPAIAESLSSTVSASGVFALVDWGESEFCQPKGDFLVLDNIQDPGNLGTIIRSALSFGFCHIYLKNCVNWRNPKVLRSTMGTIFDVRLYEIDFNKFESLSKLPLYKADMVGENIFSFQRKEEIIGLVLGNEANGISPEVDRLVQKSLSIPMQNNVESLNVAVAGAILMSKLAN